MILSTIVSCEQMIYIMQDTVFEYHVGLSIVLIHMKQIVFFITNVVCRVCNNNYDYVSSLYEAIIIMDVDCVVCKYNDKYASILVAAIYVAAIPIPNICN